MHLKELLKKKEQIGSPDGPAAPDVKIVRTTTLTSEELNAPGAPPPRSPRTPSPPAYSASPKSPLSPVSPPAQNATVLSPEKRRSRFRSWSSSKRHSQSNSAEGGGGSSNRLSQKLRLRSSSGVGTSAHVPTDLPAIDARDSGFAADDNIDEDGEGAAAGVEDSEERQARWEKRATLLAATLKRPIETEKNEGTGAGNEHAARQAASAALSAPASGPGNTRNRSPSVTVQGDVNIQEAIRLHEAGDLIPSTKMFGRLADPSGANNALSQVLYGLALRHGWGTEINSSEAVRYFSLAARNAADIETLALQAGMKRGGAAKGELVLAMYELANCFRHGWGVKVDAPAAKQYYETAANLGDTDAMNEVAWCYLHGFGTKKDKFTAAKYYRLAERTGSKTLGNTWIWKEKYDPK